MINRKLIKNLFCMKHHAGSGNNVSVMRLLKNGLPYYLNRSGKASNPLTVFININGKCNLRCKMCDVGQRNCESVFYKNLSVSKADFPFDRYKTLIDELKDSKPYISITTTEPLLYPQILDVVEYTVQSGLEINITTNGFLLEKFADDLVRLGLNKLSVSLDGPLRIHDEIRNVEGVYEHLMKGLVVVKRAKEKYGSSKPVVLCNTSVVEAKDGNFVEMMDEVDIDLFDHFNFKLMVFCTEEVAQSHNDRFGEKYPTSASCLAGGIDPAEIDVGELHAQVVDLKKRYGSKCTFYFDDSKAALAKYFTSPDQFMDSTRCVMPWYVAQITANGDMLGLTRCYASSFGNIMNKNFWDVWNGEEMRNFRKDLKKHGRFPACTRCDGVLFR